MSTSPDIQHSNVTGAMGPVSFIDLLHALYDEYPSANEGDLLVLTLAETSAANPAISSWFARHGIDLDPVLNLLEVITLHTIISTGRLFSFDEEGEPAIILPVCDEGGRPVDLLAWRPDDPLRWWLFLDNGALLGAPNVINPASYVYGPLKVHPSPLEWLQAGCQDGVVILHAARARTVLRKALGPIAATDLAHAKRLEKALAPEVTADRILIPSGRAA